MKKNAEAREKSERFIFSQSGVLEFLNFVRDRSFSARGPRLYKKRPPELHDLENISASVYLDQFKTKLDQFLSRWNNSRCKEPLNFCNKEEMNSAPQS